MLQHKCRLMQACKPNAYSIMTWVVKRIADARQYRAYALGSQQAIHARATELRGTQCYTYCTQCYTYCTTSHVQSLAGMSEKQH